MAPEYSHRHIHFSNFTVFNIVDYNHYCDIVKGMNEEDAEPQQTNRRYHSPRRLEQAEATRLAILQASRKLFAAHGYQATTLQAIAQEAGVAVPTIYAVFGSKAAVLSALIKSAGADEDIRALAREAFAATDARLQVRLAARVICAIQQRDPDIVDLLWQAGGSDPDLVAVWRQSHRQQLARLGGIIESLAEKQALKPDLSLERATDTLWALASPEMYRLLTRERGWTTQQFEDWLTESATTLLLKDD